MSNRRMTGQSRRVLCLPIFWIVKDRRRDHTTLSEVACAYSLSLQDAKALSSAIKDRRKDRAAKYSVPLPKVRGIAEEEMFKVIKTGKHKGKSWKRMVNKATFVGEGFTRKPVKLERFIRPMGLVSFRLGKISSSAEMRVAYDQGKCNPS